jgi:hypothetical protein
MTTWSSVETADIASALQIGTNTFVFETANEYFGPTEQGQGTIDTNPAGLIYEADVCYKVVDKEETAWAAGTRFTSTNWATYFTYSEAESNIALDFNPTWMVEGSGVWLATDYDWTPNTFDPDTLVYYGAPFYGWYGTLDMDDKLILQKAGGMGEGAYNLPSVPPAPGNNHRFWWDRDGVDPWQNPATANTGGIYQIIIKLHATGATTGTAYMNIRGLDQGFETDGNWNTIELTPAGMTFTGDMKHLQVFYGIYGYGATHTAKFQNIKVTQ